MRRASILAAVAVTAVLNISSCDLITSLTGTNATAVIVRTNPVDSGSTTYTGTVSTDTDGDGIGDYIDLDPGEILLQSPANGATIGDITPELVLKEKSPNLVAKYCFRLSASADMSALIVDIQMETNRYTVETGALENNRTYYWTVGVNDKAGIVYWAQEVFSFTVNIAIGTVGQTTPPDNGATNDTTPLLSWQAVTGVEKYGVQLSNSSTFTAILEQSDALTVPSYQVQAILSNNTVYYWRVRASKSGAWGAWGTYSFNVDISSVQLTTPADNAVTTDTTPTFLWGASPVAATYRLLVADNSTFTNPLVDKNTITTTSYILTGTAPELLSDGETYYWKVAAVDASNIQGPYSTVRSFIITLPVPTGSNPATGTTTNETTPLLDWADTTGATEYRIQISTSSSFISTLVDTAGISVSQYLVSVILNDLTTYYWRLRMRNGDGVWGGWSVTWSFTVQIKTAIVIIADPHTPVTIVFSGQKDHLYRDQTMVVTAIPAAAVDSYQWYLNGSSLAGANGTTIIMGPDLEAGYYRLAIRVYRNNVISTAEIVFQIHESPHLVINKKLSALGLSMHFIPIIYAGSTDIYRGVTLTAYSLGESEVTQHDYELVYGSNPSHFLGNVNRPVEQVTWTESAQFCNSISTLCGLQQVYNENTWEADFTKNGFYLPTEAQWEYAAGGPNHYTWSLGNIFDAGNYVYSQNSTQTGIVKSTPANGFGLYEMSGNVEEYCHDTYGISFPFAEQTDPNGPVLGSIHVHRGGGLSSAWEAYLRCDYRNDEAPVGTHLIGFRIAIGGHGQWQ